MVVINNKLYTLEAYNLLELISNTYLEAGGVHITRKVKESQDDFMICCPFHKDGLENSPSFGLHKNTLVGHCFTCGWSGDIYSFVSELFGKVDGGYYGIQLVNDLIKPYKVGTKSAIDFMPLDKPDEQGFSYPGFTVEELKKYRYYHGYMYKRGLTNKTIDTFDIGFDKESNSITFPVYSADATPLFIAKRSIKTKRFTLPADIVKPLYAAEHIVKSGCSRSDEIIVTESCFNTLTCWQNGDYSVALFGTGTHEQMSLLASLPALTLVLALDPDEAGEKGVNRIKSAIGHKKVLKRLVLPENEDINSLGSTYKSLQTIYI